MKTKRKRSGIEFVGALLMLTAGLAAGDHRKDLAAPHAVVGGSVFRDPGFALPGAEVVLEERTETDQKPHLKPMKAVSDDRGEFAFRVPPVEGKYLLKVSAKGYAPQQKEAEVSGQERVDVNFVLQPKESR